MPHEFRTLSDFLTLRTVDDLKKLARWLTNIQLPTRKADIIAFMVRDLTENIRTYFQQLDNLQQKAVAEAIYTPWFDEDGFVSKYGEQPDWGEKASWSMNYIETPSLLSLFILRGDRYDGSGGQKTVPDDLKVLLKEFVPQPPPPELKIHEGRPESITRITYRYDNNTRKEKNEALPLYHADTEQAAQHDLLSVLRLIDAGKIKVSDKTGRPTAASMNVITEILHGGDFYPERPPKDRFETPPGPIKAFAWPVLLQTAKLAHAKSGKLTLTPDGRKALSDPPHETIKTIWQTWIKTNSEDELRRVNAIRGQTGRGQEGLTRPSDRRAIILRTLKNCPKGQWFGFDEFFNFMRASGHLLIVSEQPWELYIGSPDYGSMHGRWELLTSRYMMAFFFEYAATLGLFNIAYIDPSEAPYEFEYDMDTDDVSRYDGLMYLQINALGAYCLGKTRSYTPTEMEIQHVLKVLPNFDIVALKPLPPGDQIALDQFADKSSDTVWTIRSEKILRAIENGQTLDHILSFLNHKSGEELPQPIAVLFDDIADKTSRLKFKGTAHLIEVKDADTAFLLSHDRDVGKHCYLSGDRHLVVPENALTAFRTALRKTGYVLPK